MTRDEIAARAICAEQCAFMGEPPCWRIAPDEWPNLQCDEPGCMALGRAVLAELDAAK
jgi:hypothetical protein